MATTANVGQSQDFGPILAALDTLKKTVPQSEKAQASKFLETFQKSVEAWSVTLALLSQDIADDVRLFAATTLKGKITYDLDQIPPDQLPALKSSLLSALTAYKTGLKPVRVQICVCLCGLAIQMKSWNTVFQDVLAALGPDGGDAFLQFLKVLPEEVNEGRKINLTEEEITERTAELLENHSSEVLDLLIRFGQSADPSKSTILLECLSSWTREIPIPQIIDSPLMNIIMNALSNDQSFDAAVDTICTIIHDTGEINSSMNEIRTLYPKIISLRPKIAQAAEAEDFEMLKGLTKIFSEAAESWVVLIAREPFQFAELLEAVFECCNADTEKESIGYTFNVWYELKQYLTMPRYEESRVQLAPVYSKLVDIMVKHLQYPTPDEEGEDLFEGNRVLEENFREFRHAMGGVLKDCCEVIGVDECLTKSYGLIQAWVAKYASESSADHVSHWQELEAPLFSMRTMGRMVNPEQNSVLPQIIPLIVQIPSQEKIRFQAIMVIARYTQWTYQHPDTLEAQLNYVMAGFQHSSQEVVQAAALAFKFLGTDCYELLTPYIPQLLAFYGSALANLTPMNRDEVTTGVAAVISAQPEDKLYDLMKSFCDPVMTSVMTLANDAKDDESQRAVANYLSLISIFIQEVSPYVPPGAEHPCVKYCGEIFPILKTLALNFPTSEPILEISCRCWRFMVISYGYAFAPLLPELSECLFLGFETSRQGCFLWATNAILREFAQETNLDMLTTTESSPLRNDVYQFFEKQTVSFFRILNDLPPSQVADVIEDFFYLVETAVRSYPKETISSPLAPHILQASLSALTLQQAKPLSATLNFLHDFVSFGLEASTVSTLRGSSNTPRVHPPEIQGAVEQLMKTHGAALTQRLLTGLMYTFPTDDSPSDIFHRASTVIMALFELLPHEAGSWVEQTIQQLPPGSVRAGEHEKLRAAISDRVLSGDPRKIRYVLPDFTNAFRRRNVAPREGLGRLEATRFEFNG